MATWSIFLWGVCLVGSGCGESVSQGGVDCPSGGCETEEEAEPSSVVDVQTWEEPEPEPDDEPLPEEEPLPEADPCEQDPWCAWQSACDGLAEDTLLEDAPLCPLQDGVCAGARRTCADTDPEDCRAETYALQTDEPVDPGGVDRWCDGLDNTCSGEVDPGCCPEADLDAWWRDAWEGVDACGHGGFLIPLMVRSGEGRITEVSITQHLGYQLDPDLTMDDIPPPELLVRAVEPGGTEEERVSMVHVYEGRALAALDASLPFDWKVVIGRGTPHGLVLDQYRWRGEGVHQQSFAPLVGWEPSWDALGGSLWAGAQQRDEDRSWLWLRSGEEAALAEARRATGGVELVARGVRTPDPAQGPSTSSDDGSFRPMAVNPWVSINAEEGAVTACVVLRASEEDTLHCDRWSWEGDDLEALWSHSWPLGYFTWDAAWLSSHPPELPLVLTLPSVAGAPLQWLEVTEEGAELHGVDQSASIQRWERAALMSGQTVGVLTTGHADAGRVSMMLDVETLPDSEQSPWWSVDRGGIDAEGWSVVSDGRLHYLTAVRWQPVACLPMPVGHVERFGVAIRHLPLSADGWPWCGGVIEASP